MNHYRKVLNTWKFGPLVTEFVGDLTWWYFKNVALKKLVRQSIDSNFAAQWNSTTLKIIITGIQRVALQKHYKGILGDNNESIN